MKSTTYLRLFRLRRLTRFFVLLAALGLVAGCDFSRVEISCNEHLASAGLGHFKDMERGVIRDSKTNLDWFRCPVGSTPYTARVFRRAFTLVACGNRKLYF